MKKIFLLFPVALIAIIFISRQEPTETFEVVLTESGFEPSELTVTKGSAIVFSTTTGKPFWPASDPHPLHDEYSALDPEKPINSDETWTFKAAKLGQWSYHDHLFFTRRGRMTVLSKSDWKERNKVLTREEISIKIDKEGGSAAYSNLKRVYDPSTSLAHSTFHLFGETLYEKEGISGILVCDEFAGFGCYHGLFIKAVNDKGISVVKDLDKECVAKFGAGGLGCPHGIGHGLIEFLGYDKIDEALSACSTLTWQGELFGCQGGVFMEYNFRTSFEDGESITTTREAQGNLYEPCQSVAQRFRQACYFEQASWWNEVLNFDYPKIGAYCGSLGSKEKDSCLLGLGNNIAERSGYDKEETVDACGQMTDSYSEAVCRAGGAWAFFANPEVAERPEEVCQGLGTYENICLEKRVLVN